MGCFDMNMQDRVVFITGAARGIGQALTEAFLDTGARVAFVDRDGEAGRAAEAELATRGRVCFIEADVSNEGAVSLAVEQVCDRFGQLDVLINNAGVCLRKPLQELSLVEWQRVLDVNLTGAFLCCRAWAGELTRRKGVIINIASNRAAMSEADMESYAASKGGLVALTHALAISLGPAVRVNCISPGWIDVSARRPGGVQTTLSAADHQQHPAGRVGVPSDVARLALFLADPANDFLTGQNLTLDGGMTRKMIYR